MKRLKTIIAGGRNYALSLDDFKFLDSLPISEVVSGGATGADRCGEIWAARNGIPVKKFPAAWSQYGPSAGPRRNRQMAEYADCVVLFPGGAGTASMRLEAKKLGLQIIDRSGQPSGCLSPLAQPKNP